MQLSAIFLTVCCLSVTARTVSQSVTYSGKDVKLETVLDAIEQQTGYFVFFEEGLAKNGKPVNVDAQNMPLKHFLDEILKDQPFTYSLKRTTITISRKNPAAYLTPRLPYPSLNSPPITVRGRILNEKSEPVIASVIIKGTSRGTTSNADGFFELAGVDEKAVLIFSGANITTKEVLVDGKSVLNVSVLLKIAIEEEVIINKGYYTEKKKLSTSNVSKVTAKEIGNQPVVSPLLALQGRVPGLEITMPANATPGVAPTIRIRGNNSLRVGGKGTVSLEDDGNFPLYVIDGAPVMSAPLKSIVSELSSGGYDPLSTINPANIESIEILKDADATAIYGSRGANGVILITTKQSKKGGERTSVDMNAYKGIGQLPRKLDLLNTEQYLAMRREGLANKGRSAGDSDFDLKYWDPSRYTDWQEVLLGGTARITDIQGIVSGGNKNTSFRFGGGGHKETLILSNDFGYDRASGQASINHTSSNERFKAGINVNYGLDKNSLLSGGSAGSVMEIALTLPPNAPELYKQDGSLNWEIHDYQGAPYSTWNNPLAYRENKQQVRTRNLIANANLSYQLISGLWLAVNAGYTDLSNTDKYILPGSGYSPTRNDIVRIAGFQEVNRGSWIIEPKISYSKTVNQHNLELIIGTSWQQNNSSILQLNASGYSSDALMNSLTGANQIRVVDDTYTEYKYQSIYGRIGYNFKQKYLFNITGRRDASSRFAPGKRTGNFGAIGLGWIFSDELIIQKAIPFLSHGKLRGSYGINGSDAVADYQFYDLYNILATTYDGVVGVVPFSLYNPEFVWEATKKLELGIELAFLNNRVGVEINFYRNRSSNQLVNYSMPYTTGFPSVLTNFNATVQNTGLEALLHLGLVTNKNWRWNMSFNLSVPHNKLLQFDGIENSPYVNVYKVGEPLSIQWLYTWAGVDPQTGLHTFLDENKDGKISDLDKRLINPLDVKYYGGANNTIQYKSLELSVQFQFSNRPGQRYMFTSPPGWLYNQPIEILNRWFAPGDQTDVQRFAATSPDQEALNSLGTATQSTYNNQNIYFIKLRSLSLSYSLPLKWTKKFALDHAKLFIQGQNLFTFTEYPGLDPETGLGLPPLRMITAGIQLRL